MDSRFDELLRRLGVIDDLVRAGTLLGWDEETKMPPAGGDARAEARATLNRIAHELQVTRPLSVVMAEKVEALRAWAQDRTVPAG